MTTLLLIPGLIALVLFLIPPWGWNRYLLNAIKKQLQTNEPVVFQTAATRSPETTPRVQWLRRGYLTITDRRLIIAFWKELLPAWTMEEIAVSDITEANVHRVLSRSQVELIARDRQLSLFPNDGSSAHSDAPALDFARALRKVSGGRITTGTSDTFAGVLRNEAGSGS